MTVPATINTPYRCIDLAMRDAGILDEAQTPDSNALAQNMGRLQDMVNLWQTQGLKLWLNEDVSVPLVAGTATYFFGSGGIKPLRVIQAYYQDANLQNRPLIALSRDEYVRLSTPTQTGQINSYFVDKQQTTLNVSFWLVPDAVAATGTAHLILQQPVDQLVSLTDQISFPIEWFIALRWGLSEEISTGQPRDIVDRCKTKANEYRTALEDWDVEDASTYFTPDSRQTQNASNGRFK